MKQWFGGHDSKTSPSHFYGSHEYHWEKFCKVRDRLFALSVTYVGNRPAVELIYVDDEGINFVIAYRFTSDEAHDLYHSELVRLGGSLGRGVWSIFGTDAYDQHNYLMFFTKNEQKHGFNPPPASAAEYFKLKRKEPK